MAEVIECPHCGARVITTDDVCPACRNTVKNPVAGREDKAKLVETTIAERYEREVAPMQIHCPQCQNPIEVIEGSPLTDILCTACGSRFSHIGENAPSTKTTHAVRDNDFYDRLRAKIHSWATSDEGKQSKWVEYVLFLPDFLHLLCSLTLDPEIPVKQKAKLGIVIAYVISPIDLLPEGLIGPLGYLDDIALSAYVLNQIVNQVDEKIVLRHWKGSADLLRSVKHILEVADEMVGSGLWKKLQALVGGK